MSVSLQALTLNLEPKRDIAEGDKVHFRVYDSLSNCLRDRLLPVELRWFEPGLDVATGTVYDIKRRNENGIVYCSLKVDECYTKSLSKKVNINIEYVKLLGTIDWCFSECKADYDLGIMYVELVDSLENIYRKIRVYRISTTDITQKYIAVSSGHVKQYYTIVRNGIMSYSVDNNGRPLLNLYKLSDDSSTLTKHKITIRDYVLNKYNDKDKYYRNEYYAKFDAKSNMYVLCDGTTLFIYDIANSKFIVDNLQGFRCRYTHCVIINDDVFTAADNGIIRINLYTGCVSLIVYPQLTEPAYTNNPLTYLCKLFGTNENGLTVYMGYGEDVGCDVAAALEECSNDLVNYIIDIYSREPNATICKTQIVKKKREDYLKIIHNITVNFNFGIDKYDRTLDLVFADILFKRPTYCKNNLSVTIDDITCRITQITSADLGSADSADSSDTSTNSSTEIVLNHGNSNIHISIEDPNRSHDDSSDSSDDSSDTSTNRSHNETNLLCSVNEWNDYRQLMLSELLKYINKGLIGRYHDDIYNMRIGNLFYKNYILTNVENVDKGITWIDLPLRPDHVVEELSKGSDEKYGFYYAVGYDHQLMGHKVTNSYGKQLMVIKDVSHTQSFKAFDSNGDTIVFWATSHPGAQKNTKIWKINCRLLKNDKAFETKLSVCGKCDIYIKPKHSVIICNKTLVLIPHIAWVDEF